ncbi:hypothetical protein [Amycolatopsis sp. NPDC051071]|uniref:hypothetical protein n=1 Tax=Amycolatopsis sp. NPDC051071 TaxID=3154637 RepID=UPI0034377A16
MTYQQYPPQGGYPPPGAYPPPGMAPKPNGATGIIAAILAILGGVWFLAGVVLHVIELSDDVDSFLVIGAVLDFVSAALLLLGGILLLMRKGAGRVLTAVGAAFPLFMVLVTIVVRSLGLDFYFSYGGLSLFFGIGGVLIQVLLPAIATLVLALIPPTARWVAAKKQAAVPPPHFGYPQARPGYPPPGQW